MKIKKLSKINMALRIALPCLALSVIMPSCSNDDISEDVVADDSISTGLVFNASFPALEENPSTRMGLNESLIPINPNITEPLIWIAGDKLSFNFVASGTTGQVIEYEVTNVGSRGRSCSLRPVTSTILADGTYNVYAVTPASEDNFPSGLSTLCGVDLSDQSQPEVVDRYKNLSNYLYMYAKTTVVIQNGAIVSGGNNLSFAIATSLLRFRVTNATGDEVAVDKITINKTGSATSQFYTYRNFDPTSSTTMFSSGSRVNSLTLETDKTLSDDGTFDAYLSIFPTEGYSSVDDNKISIRVDYIANGENKHQDWEWPVSAFSSSAPYAAFRSSARFLFNLTLSEEDGEDNANSDGTKNEQIGSNTYKTYKFPIGVDGADVTWMVQNSKEGSPMHAGTGHGSFYNPANRSSACPYGWRLPSIAELLALCQFVKSNEMTGVFFGDAAPKHAVMNGMVQSTTDFMLFCSNGCVSVSSDASAFERTWLNNVSYYVRCLRE